MPTLRKKKKKNFIEHGHVGVLVWLTETHNADTFPEKNNQL